MFTKPNTSPVGKAKLDNINKEINITLMARNSESLPQPTDFHSA